MTFQSRPWGGRGQALGAARHALLLQWRAAPAQSAGLIVTTIAIGASSPTIAWLARLLINELARRPADSARAVTLAVALVAAGAVTNVSLYVAGYLLAVAKQRLTIAVQEELFERVSRLSGLRYFEEPAFHDRLQLAEEAAQDAPQAITAFAQEGARAAITIGAFFAAMLAVWPPIALLMIAAMVPAMVAQVRQSQRRAAVAESVVGTYRRQLFYRTLLTDVRAAKEIRLFGLGALLHGRMVSSLAEASGAELKIERRAMIGQGALGLLTAAVGGAGVLVVVVGAVHGRFSIGDLTLFLAAVGGLEGTFAGVVSHAGQLGKALYLFSNYLQITQAPDDLPSGRFKPTALQNGVEFSDVWFRYGGNGPWVLRGVDCFIPQGSTVGVVGLNGAGKSTLVKLLCRFYDPQHGTITWDGRSLRDLEVADLRRRLGVTFQDFMNYELTAGENIGLGDYEQIDNEARIHGSAELAGIAEVISELPKGYGTLLSRTSSMGIGPKA